MLIEILIELGIFNLVLTIEIVDFRAVYKICLLIKELQHLDQIQMGD